jgi:flagellar hook-associated protein 3 FlgL
MMTTNLLLNVNRNLQKMSNMQDQLATGKRISKPSDDPVLASKILARKTDLSELDQYDKNTRDALGWMEITEKAIEDNGDLLQRVRELTVQAANGTNTASDTQKIAEEIKNLKEQLISNGNATFAGRYIFSGFSTDKALLKKDGSYNIDVDDYAINNKPIVKYEISVGESMDVMTSGLSIYEPIPSSNVMTESFPTGKIEGTASRKGYLTVTFDFDLDYTAANLDVTIGGTPYNVDTAGLSGLAKPISKEAVITAYNNALGANGTAYFNQSNELVIEAGLPGAAAASGMSAAGVTITSTVPGFDKVEAVINNGTNNFVDPLPADQGIFEEVLRNNSLNIIVNGVSRKVKPDATLVSPFDVADYVTHMQTRFDTAFNGNKVNISVVAGQLTVETVNTSPGTQPTLVVDFPRAHENQLIKDMDQLISLLEVGDHTGLSTHLGVIDGHMENMLSLRADIGARNNRLELTAKKIASNSVTFTGMLSDAQDADMAEIIMLLKNAENVYKASLSTGARVIQPSLLDFLR